MTQERDSLSTNMRRCNLCDVLRARAKRGTKTEDKATKHKDLDIWSEALDERSNNGEKTPEKVDAATTNLIRNAEKRSATEIADSHKSVDDTECRAAIFETEVVMPVEVGVDAANDTPIDTIPTKASARQHQGCNESTALRGLVKSHGHHDEKDAKASLGLQRQSLPGLGDQVVFSDSGCDDLFNSNA